MARARLTQVERAAIARRKLVDATSELIAEHGLEGFSFVQVGERAGVSRALVTHHFGFRERLVDEVIGELLERPATSDLGLTPLFSFFRSFLAPAGAGRVRALLVVLSAPNLTTTQRAAVSRYFAAIEGVVEDHLRVAEAEGGLSARGDALVTSKVLVAALLGGALAVSSADEADRATRAKGFLETMERAFFAIGVGASAKRDARATPRAPKPSSERGVSDKPVERPQQGSLFEEASPPKGRTQ